MANCPLCEGKGSIPIHVANGPNEVPCRTCQGTGKVTREKLARIAEGRKIQESRRERGLTIHQAAAERNLTPVAYLALELGWEAA